MIYLNVHFLATAGGSGLGGGRIFPDFFDALIGFLDAFWKWFIGLLNAVSYVIELCFDSLAISAMFSGLLPSFLSSCVIIVLVVSIVKLIFGR